MSGVARRFRVYTRNYGNHEVTAESNRHAVAAVVARLGLTEQQTAQVTTWAVSEVRGPDKPEITP